MAKKKAPEDKVKILKRRIKELEFSVKAICAEMDRYKDLWESTQEFKIQKLENTVEQLENELETAQYDLELAEEAKSELRSEISDLRVFGC